MRSIFDLRTNAAQDNRPYITQLPLVPFPDTQPQLHRLNRPLYAAILHEISINCPGPPLCLSRRLPKRFDRFPYPLALGQEVRVAHDRGNLGFRGNIWLVLRVLFPPCTKFPRSSSKCLTSGPVGAAPALVVFVVHLKFRGIALAECFVQRPLPRGTCTGTGTCATAGFERGVGAGRDPPGRSAPRGVRSRPSRRIFALLPLPGPRK